MALQYIIVNDTPHIFKHIFQVETGRYHGKSAEFCPYQCVLDTFLTDRETVIGTSPPDVADR